jgi:hypothetical protein
MGLFKKKENKEEIPSLPELPKLPDLPNWKGDEFSNEKISQLPSFPNGSLGNKFSQDTIKKAVTGEKEEGGNEADESAMEEIQMMQKPSVQENQEHETYGFAKPKIREAEPIFIRMDRFEEGSRTFENVKRQVFEIEKMLRNIKEIKEKEEAELKEWEIELKQIKEKIEQVDSKIFSKLE